MSINVETYSYKFSTKNWEKNSGKCEGILYFSGNSLTGEIYDWYVQFSKIKLDLYTTESWFKTINSNYKLREDLIRHIFNNTKNQIIRPNKKTNLILELDENQLRLANLWFKNKYKSTLKNVIAIISGNNPTGSFSKPNNAQMYISEENFVEKWRENFIMFFDKIVKFSLIDKKNINDFLKVDLKKLEKVHPTYLELLNSKHINLIKFLEIFCLEMEEFNSLTSKQDTIDFLANDVKESFDKLINIKKQLIKSIENFRKNLPISIKVFNADKDYERAHIKNVSDIKNESISSLIQLFSSMKNINIQNIDKTNEYKNIIETSKQQIISSNNLLDLSRDVHGFFDKNYFTYSEINGEIIWNPEIHQKINNKIDEKYLQIPNNEMTNERKKFLKARNKNISFLNMKNT